MWRGNLKKIKGLVFILLIRNGFVCLRNLTFQNQKTFLRRAKPVRPFWQFLYVQLCSWMQNLFLKFRNRFRNYYLKCFPSFRTCQNWILFLILQTCLSRSLNQIFRNRNVHHHARLPRPSWQFGSVLIGSSMQSLGLKFRFRFLTGLCLMIRNPIRLGNRRLVTRNLNYLANRPCRRQM